MYEFTCTLYWTDLWMLILHIYFLINWYMYITRTDRLIGNKPTLQFIFSTRSLLTRTGDDFHRQQIFVLITWTSFLYPFFNILFALSYRSVYILSGMVREINCTFFYFKYRPVLHHCVVIFFLVLRYHGVYMYVVNVWKWSSAYALDGVSGVVSIITTDEQLQ